MNRATQFKTVILDFEGVVHVGLAFVDEVFRVFATAHPRRRLKTMGMSSEEAKMVFDDNYLGRLTTTMLAG
jgi:hypothetical protein